MPSTRIVVQGGGIRGPQGDPGPQGPPGTGGGGGGGGDVAGDTHAASAKATVVGADQLPLADSAASWVLKNVTVTVLANFMKLLRLDQFATPTSDVAMGGKKLTGLADPSNAQDAATKTYVDGLTSAIPDDLSDLTGTVSYSQMAPNSCFAVIWTGTQWEVASNPGVAVTARPTARTDLTMIAKGGTATPSFGIAGDLWLEDNS